MMEREPGRGERDFDMYKDRPSDLKPLKSISGWKMSGDAVDIRGWKLVDKDGNDIGQVDDLLMSESAGEALFAIVSMGGTAGVGAMHHVVPLDKLSINKDDKRVMFHGTGDHLHNSPEYKSDTHDFSGFYDYWSGVRGTSGYGPETETHEFRHYVVYPGETEIAEEEEEETERTRGTNF